MSYEIKVTDKKHPAFGKKLNGAIIYYDYAHTGSSPHLLHATDKEGNKYRLLSNQIDIEHYEAQEIAEEIERLGAKVGDIVRILRSGSGSYSGKWKSKGEHVITKIDPSGHVEFDNGEASMFRPDVEKVS